jgi:hypothetical protein
LFWARRSIPARFPFRTIPRRSCCGTSEISSIRPRILSRASTRLVDTNILMYAHDTAAGEKHARAKPFVLGSLRVGAESVHHQDRPLDGDTASITPHRSGSQSNHGVAAPIPFWPRTRRESSCLASARSGST